MILMNKQNFSIIIGNALEYYDFMLFGFFAAILAPLFFPSDIPGMSLIVSMATYGVGFLARPLGGIFFGHLGDRWGRKDTLSLSILLVTFPTLGIALLPTYSQIGIWAPLLLVLCRLLQGFCLGGEASGAMTYVVENTSPQEKDMASAWLVVSCYVGTLVGTLLGSFFTLPFMPTEGWRFTFAVGSLIAIAGYYIRRYLKESPEFLETKRKGKILKIPLKELLKNEKRNLFYAMSISSAVIVPFMTIFVYLNSLFIKNLHLEASLVLLLNSGLMGTWIFLLLLFGYCAQQYGRNIIMSIGALGMALLAYPLFLFMGTDPNLESILITQLLLSVFASAYAAPTSALLVDLFPINERYSGIAFGYSLGHAIFGGLTPLLLTFLVHSLGLTSAPAVLLIFSSLLGSIVFYNPNSIFHSKTALKIQSNF
ncbi:MAG: MFS transporter [Alphaproteobacteria bacterium]|nr:MFS transporter [Alphaproteobacteria bacterium]